ncbi:hypothetical protein [Rhodonellum sp.]|uniref:hypothetical protein n=1 Tax=Rhodonellum sp. TaxID=2231180 RepID=UPI0027159DE4|nr:hypothetical protein [Rhodonellum sp.]MDO9551040.1 hypothetical protein [Rhodonellum sp.]
MSNRYPFYVIILIVVALLFWIGKESFTQPGVGDLELDFEEMASFRNENNTGPVLRVYAVFAPDTLWDVMRKYGEFMPHTKYGNTKVFFFGQKNATPTKVGPDEPFFDISYQEHCIGVYEKSAMGQERFRRYPFQ